MMEHSLLLFSSATPRTETYHAAISSRMRLVTLTHRYGGRPLPTVDFIDMRAELAAGNPREVSQRMVQELAANLQREEQSILLLNRRGYQTVGMCGTCGHVLKCPNCSVPLVYHKAQHALLCHYCGHRVSPVPGLCPECGGKIVYSGFGTQKVEEELAELLPGTRILRMDQDSTMQKNAHEKMLARFAKQEYDILLGTQMVAKGLDFGNVTLVGVLGIDSLLFGQGFRSYENVFSLITQVVGRGGRAELPGRALIQTAVPDHPVLQLAASARITPRFTSRRSCSASSRSIRRFAHSAWSVFPARRRWKYFRLRGVLPPFWGSSSLHTPTSRCVCLAPPP